MIPTIRSPRLAARFGLSSAEREDLQQDLLLDLLEHESQFDPAKASANTFAGGLRIAGGTLVAAHANAPGAGDVTLAGGALQLSGQQI